MIPPAISAGDTPPTTATLAALAAKAVAAAEAALVAARDTAAAAASDMTSFGEAIAATDTAVKNACSASAAAAAAGSATAPGGARRLAAASFAQGTILRYSADARKSSGSAATTGIDAYRHARSVSVFFAVQPDPRALLATTWAGALLGGSEAPRGTNPLGARPLPPFLRPPRASIPPGCRRR